MRTETSENNIQESTWEMNVSIKNEISMYKKEYKEKLPFGTIITQSFRIWVKPWCVNFVPSYEVMPIHENQSTGLLLFHIQIIQQEIFYSCTSIWKYSK